MRMLVSSDWHLDAVTAGVRRIDEFRDYVSTLIAVSRNVDLVCLLGDYYDPGTMAAHRCESLLFAAVGELSAAGTSVVVLSGNHDVVEGASGTVTTLGGMREAVSYGYGRGAVTVVEWPMVLPFPGITLVCLPYVSRANRGVYSDDSVRSLVERALLPSSEDPIVVIGHLTVAGADLGNESEEFARGSELDFPAGIARLSPNAVFNGHYHKPQTVRLHGMDIVIPGSPQRLTFSETGDYPKGFLMVEL